MENQKKLSRINQKNTDSFAKQSETLLNYDFSTTDLLVDY